MFSAIVHCHSSNSTVNHGLSDPLVHAQYFPRILFVVVESSSIPLPDVELHSPKEPMDVSEAIARAGAEDLSVGGARGINTYGKPAYGLKGESSSDCAER